MLCSGAANTMGGARRSGHPAGTGNVGEGYAGGRGTLMVCSFGRLGMYDLRRGDLKKRAPEAENH
jgi:hypothetical protein